MKAFIIGIAGGSGSGKTTFIEKLQSELSDDMITFVSMDNYYKPREEQLVDDAGYKNFDLPGSLDQLAFVEDVLKLQRGEPVEQVEYTFNNDEHEGTTIYIKPSPIIIVEGLFVFHYEEVQKILDLKIFIEAKENLKVIRRIKRDGIERNYPLEDVLYRYQHHVLPSYEKYILPYKSNSDIIVNNNHNGFQKALEVVKGFIKNRVGGMN